MVVIRGLKITTKLHPRKELLYLCPFSFDLARRALSSPVIQGAHILRPQWLAEPEHHTKPYLYSQSSVALGSTFADKTNHRWKTFGKNHLCTCTTFFLIIFPNEYTIMTISIAFTLYQVSLVIYKYLNVYGRLCKYYSSLYETCIIMDFGIYREGSPGTNFSSENEHVYIPCHTLGPQLLHSEGSQKN
jgi:hypothetical protein